jgi:hypothetical protein
MKLLAGNDATGLSDSRDSVRRYAALGCLAETDRLDKAVSGRRATAHLDVARDGCATGRRIRQRNRPDRIRRRDQKNHGPEQHGDASGPSYPSNAQSHATNLRLKNRSVTAPRVGLRYGGIRARLCPRLRELRKSATHRVGWAAQALPRTTSCGAPGPRGQTSPSGRRPPEGSRSIATAPATQRPPPDDAVGWPDLSCQTPAACRGGQIIHVISHFVTYKQQHGRRPHRRARSRPRGRGRLPLRRLEAVIRHVE